MNDTPHEILKKQFEIIYSKPIKERISNLFEMTELSRNIIKNQIKQKKPGLTETELKVELFKIFYRDDFDEATLQKIAREMKHYLEKQD